MINVIFKYLAGSQSGDTEADEYPTLPSSEISGAITHGGSRDDRSSANAQACIFWCAVATGGLVQGRPVPSVRLCRGVVEAWELEAHPQRAPGSLLFLGVYSFFLLRMNMLAYQLCEVNADNKNGLLFWSPWRFFVSWKLGVVVLCVHSPIVSRHATLPLWDCGVSVCSTLNLLSSRVFGV